MATTPRPEKKTETAPFMKADTGKVRLELLPFGPLVEVGKVMTFGAKKYREHNWRRCPSRARYLGAALRHLFAWALGEDFDPESGLRHTAHACCCCLFLLGIELDGVAADDRDHWPDHTPEEK